LYHEHKRQQGYRIVPRREQNVREIQKKEIGSPKPTNVNRPKRVGGRNGGGARVESWRRKKKKKRNKKMGPKRELVQRVEKRSEGTKEKEEEL